MAELYFTSNYVQTLLPDIRDNVVAPLAAATVGTAAASAVQTVLGLYGAGSYITRVGLINGTASVTLPNCTVEMATAGGVIGTLYSILGTQTEFAGTLLGKPLTATAAWIQITPSGTLGLDTRVCVDYVREA